MDLRSRYTKNNIKDDQKESDISDRWLYYGGNDGKDLDYFFTVSGRKDLPEINQDFCMCGRILKPKVFYLKNIYKYKSDNSDILIVGKCCIYKYGFRYVKKKRLLYEYEFKYVKKKDFYMNKQ